MNRPVQNAKPHRGNRGAGGERKGNKAYMAFLWTGCGARAVARIPGNWRDHLPDPATYYGQHVAKLGQPKANGYAVGLCPFHDDHSPSFGVKLTGERGLWCCYAGCGKGDMVAFHQRLTGLDFKAAVRDLIGGSR